MTAFAERGKAKAEARQAKAHARLQRRYSGKIEVARSSHWRRLEATIDPGTRERLLDFVADAPTVEQAERVLYTVARWAMGQPDPHAAINNQLNEAEKAEDARPKIDPAWLPTTATTETAPEAAQEAN